MSGVYIHLPFCKQKCSYCNFHFSTQLSQVDALCQALNQEIVLRTLDKKLEISSLYFGGGTPSIIPLSHLETLMNTLHSTLNLNSLTEATLECNPDDVTLEKLKTWKALGINRLSLGVQSFFQEDLESMNRAHSVSQAHQSIEWIRQAGFDNFTLDLIYGTPNSSDDRWLQNLEYIKMYEVPHFSAYALTVEPKTALSYQIQKGLVPQISEDLQWQQFRDLQAFAKNNDYTQYEISNFARSRYKALHNTNYWRGNAYLGIGPSAHSFDGLHTRCYNVAHNIRYIQSIEKGELPQQVERLSDHDRYNETVMLGLRSIEGIQENELHSFGPKILTYFLKNIEPYLSEQIVLKEKGIYKLHPEYYFRADGIASDLFWLD